MPEVTDDELVFRLADPEGRYTAVRLQQDVRLPGELLGFTRSGEGWVLRVPRPGVARMEYAFEVQHAAGGTEHLCDPVNPERVAGPFGDTSVLEMPGYAAPAWLDADPPRGPRRDLQLASRGLRVDGVTRSATFPDPVPVVMTCGAIEENDGNNRLMTRALGAQGYDTRLVENPDVHTYTGWRDTFDPHLVDLVHRVLDGPAR